MIAFDNVELSSSLSIMSKYLLRASSDATPDVLPTGFVLYDRTLTLPLADEFVERPSASPVPVVTFVVVLAAVVTDELVNTDCGAASVVKGALSSMTTTLSMLVVLLGA